MLLVQILLLQWLCGYYYHSDSYFKDPIYNPFSDLPIHFNIQLQPEVAPAESGINITGINRDYQSNYNEFIGSPSHFQEQPQSNFQHSLEVMVNQSSGIPFALMPARYFATPDCNQEKIIEGYYVYCKDTSINDAFIDLVKESVPAQQKASLKIADFQLASEWWKSLRLHEQYALESAQRFKNRIGALSDRTLVDGKLAIERLLLQETDDLESIIETHTSPLIREQVGALRSCVTAAREFTQLKQFNTASTILDFCWSFTELAATLSVAAAKGLANAAIHAHDHPEEVAIGLAVGIASSILPLHVVCAYHAICMISCCMPTIKDVIKIVRTAPHDPTQGLADFKTYLSPLTTFVEKIQTKEISLTQLAESTIMFTAETYAEQKMFV